MNFVCETPGSSENPEVRFQAEDGTEHSVWPVRDPVDVFALQRAFEAVKNTYIADGHHRSASAFRWVFRAFIDALTK